MAKIYFFTLLVLLSKLSSIYAVDTHDNSLRLPSGESLVSIYFFTHWWEPWKSSKNEIRRDLKRLREVGVNTLCLDHEPQQAFDGNWRWIDRAYSLAKEEGMKIIPWLEVQCVADAHVFKEWYSISVPPSMKQNGESCSIKLFHPLYRQALEKYARDYLQRYLGKEELLRVVLNGKERPVISLTVEVGWNEAGFDEESINLFRTWLRKKYRSIPVLNKAWETEFSSFDEIDPRDTTIFPYAETIRKASEYRNRSLVPLSVQEHARWKATIINDALADVKASLLKDYPDLLFLVEVPYNFSNNHPQAISYTFERGMFPDAVAHADIVMFRTVDNALSQEELTECRNLQMEGKFVILSHRTYDVDRFSGEDRQKLIIWQATNYANGLGYYTWNEMLDTHIARHPDTEAQLKNLKRLNALYQQNAR